MMGDLDLKNAKNSFFHLISCIEARWTGSTNSILEISAATGLGMDSGMWKTPAK
jgi:hypothetical protein